MKRFRVRHLVLAVGVAGDDDYTALVTNATFCPPCHQGVEGLGLEQLKAQLREVAETR